MAMRRLGAFLWAATVATAMATTTTACAGRSAADAPSRPATTLTVLAAASLSRSFPAIASAFEAAHPNVRVRFSFAGTDQLAAQIEQGAPADVFAGASTAYGEGLFRARLVERPAVFCTNALVIVVPVSNPARIVSAADLARPGVQLVVGAASVPVGAYTRTVLSNLDATYGPAYSRSVLANVVSNEPDVTSVVAKVSTGEADVGFVYVTDYLANASKLRRIDLAAAAEAVASYPIAVVRASPARAQARAFVGFVRGPKGQAVLRAAGFGPGAP